MDFQIAPTTDDLDVDVDADDVSASDERPAKKKTRVRTKNQPWIRNKVYSYGANAPTLNLDKFDDELKKGHRFRNSMVELELERRKRVGIAAAALPGVEELRQVDEAIAEKVIKIAELREEKKQKHIKASSKKIIDKELSKQIKSARSELKKLKARQKELRADSFESEEWKQGEKDRKAWLNEEMRQRYQAANLDAWGTAVRIQEETSKCSKGRPPRFKRFNGEGKVAVQLQHGLSVQDALSCTDTRLQIQPVPEKIWVPGARKRKPDLGKLADRNQTIRLDADGYPMRCLGNAIVRMRIATETVMVESSAKSYLAAKKRAEKCGKEIKKKLVKKFVSVWCEFPINMHRPLPPAAQIKWAWLQRKRVGTARRWEFQLVLAEDTREQEIQSELATDGVVAVDVGWRLSRATDDEAPCGFRSKEHGELVHASDCGHFGTRNGLRTAYWVGSDGQEGEIRLPARWLCAYYKVRDIQSIRDKRFNEIREELLSWAKRRALPEWLSEMLHGATKWRNPVRLVRVFFDWRKKRFDGDDQIYAAVHAWQKQDRHLFNYSSSLRVQVNRWRANIYRKAVMDLRRRYKVVVLEDINMSALARRKEPEDSHLEKDAARRNRTAACISSLRSFFGERMDVVKVNPYGTSFRCSSCGADSFRGSAAGKHTCSNCGTTWDRDSNACHNILKLGLQQLQSKKK